MVITSHTAEAHQRRRTRTRAERIRRKVTRACDACKARKKACTGDIPCESCVRLELSCTYDVPYNRGSAAFPQPSSRPMETGGGNRANKTPAARVVDGAVATPSPTENPGRRSVTTSSSLAATHPTPEDGNSTEVGGQYRGPASAHSFLDRAVRNLHGAPPPLSLPSEDVSASIFSHGDRHAPRTLVSQMRWPDRSTADYLIRRYFEFASPTYRVLHQGTVDTWAEALFGPNEPLEGETTTSAVSSAAKAILLLLCATSSLFSTRDGSPAQNTQDWSNWQDSETYYQIAEQILAQETGAPSLESAQARFLTVLYLLSTSRVNQAWYNFGTTVQLVMALGLHRKQTRPRAFASIASSAVAAECSKRVLWCSFTLDEYLSLILGRPRLLREEDIDQEYPTLINDEALDYKPRSRSAPLRNCLMDASVCHAKISRILARASRDLYSIKSLDKEQEVETIAILMEQITEWQSKLPPLLGDWVCPSSLISIFRRQLTVIRLARLHAIMFVTRPLLLRDYSQRMNIDGPLKQFLRTCIYTVRDTLELVLELVKDNLLFPAFWYTQYIAFTALSIVYIYLIHSKKGRIPYEWLFAHDESQELPPIDRMMLYNLAEETQYHLGHATEMNALAWRYTVVLKALRLEAMGEENETHVDDVADSQVDSNEEAVATLPMEVVRTEGVPHEQLPVDWTGLWTSLIEPVNPSIHGSGLLDSGIGGLLSFNGLTDELCLDFWPQLDRLPTSLLNSRNA
ncbi:uncharacterized protein N7496_011349 [Penicillium cataractarum]|uniref:Zn(2)-C6 fungal-type domain-containing protein n=1 Tax=Penicillium cataractarum TaxID=2100454 RepID=A0A9W9REY0_9EURO|nr:uncharacterized protein N7496_011349 [Penicillium cataractarum]KAJ5358936.1 hypothetical protein N7496_011349 [Penicillium cataractarum]